MTPGQYRNGHLNGDLKTLLAVRECQANGGASLADLVRTTGRDRGTELRYASRLVRQCMLQLLSDHTYRLTGDGEDVIESLHTPGPAYHQVH